MMCQCIYILMFPAISKFVIIIITAVTDELSFITDTVRSENRIINRFVFVPKRYTQEE